MAEGNPGEKLHKDEKSPRTELKEALSQYVSDTFSYIETVKDFLKENSKWMLMRETELNMLVDIKERATSIDLSVSHVTQSQDKGKAFLEYMKSKFTKPKADSRRAELEEELAASLKATLIGLERLQHFLDAVEKLAVTSVQVFQEDNPVLHLTEEIDLGTVQDIINAAQILCPLLVVFKRDANAFFKPKLQNVEVLAYQLDQYIKAVQKICGNLKKGPFSDFCFTKSAVDIDEDFSEEDIQRMFSHINVLNELRMDEAFRMVFMFQEECCCSFIDKFSQCQPRMLQFLDELEDSAVQLDQMNKGAKISSVAGSSVGAAGGVLSIIGLALIPVTAGVSLALTMTGVGMGITSGVNSLVTTATEIGVNRTQQKRASETFQKFMEDVKSLQVCLDEVTYQNSNIAEVAFCVGKVLCKGANVAKGIDSLVDAASAVKVLKSEQLVASAGKAVAEEANALRNVPRVASELPDIGQAAAKGPLALSKTARGGFIALNALFLGMDVFFIVKDSISLAKGSETEVSKFIRARAALWRSEMDVWQKIHDSLEKGQLSFQKKQAILKSQFYLDV